MPTENASAGQVLSDGASPPRLLRARYGAGATAVAEPEVLVDTDIAPDQHSPTGEYVCPNCGHHYSEKAGEPREGFPPGTPWADIPATWSCSACGVRDKIDFRPVT